MAPSTVESGQLACGSEVDFLVGLTLSGAIDVHDGVVSPAWNGNIAG